MTDTPQITMVALCQQFDIAAYLGSVITKRHPHIRVLRPAEVADPAAIRHALVFRPGPQDFDRFPNIELVCTGAAGVDGILGHPGLRPGMTVVRTFSDRQAEMMTAFVLYYVTGWNRRLWDYPKQQAARQWEWINTESPHDLPVGILGYGHMGAKVAAVLASTGYPVTALARTPRKGGPVRVVTGAKGLSEIARTCRVVVNIPPLTPQTSGLLNAAFFAQMPQDTLLLQIGRGGHLVEADLLAGLAAGRPARAALDVFETEPLPDDHPFWDHPRIMVTPHIASLPPREESADWLAKAIAQFEAGEVPQGRVDLARGY